MVKNQRGERSFLIGSFKKGLMKKTILHRQRRKEGTRDMGYIKGWCLFKSCWLATGNKKIHGKQVLNRMWKALKEKLRSSDLILEAKGPTEVMTISFPEKGIWKTPNDNKMTKHFSLNLKIIGQILYKSRKSPKTHQRLEQMEKSHKILE